MSVCERIGENEALFVYPGLCTRCTKPLALWLIPQIASQRAWSSRRRSCRVTSPVLLILSSSRLPLMFPTLVIKNIYVYNLKRRFFGLFLNSQSVAVPFLLPVLKIHY